MIAQGNHEKYWFYDKKMPHRGLPPCQRLMKHACQLIKWPGRRLWNVKRIFPFFSWHSHSTLHPLSLQMGLFHFQSSRWRLRAVQSLSRQFGISIRRQSGLLSLSQLWCIFAFSQIILLNKIQTKAGRRPVQKCVGDGGTSLSCLYASSNYIAGDGVSLSHEHLK